MIAASADMYSSPFPSILIGFLAGIASTLFLHFFPTLMAKIKYYDTRGILFTHGFPGLLASVVSSISTSIIRYCLFDV